jgi:integrase
MADKRVTVWVQQFKDRKHLMLQWIDPVTGKRKSRSAETADPGKAEDARADLEYELNHGKYQEASRMTWERFRELFEQEFVAGKRPRTQQNYQDTLNLFERICQPAQLRAVNERVVSAFVAGMRQRPGRNRPTMEPGSIKVRLQFLHTALAWAVEQRLLPEIPKFPSVRVPKKKPQPIPVEAFERLLAKALDPQMRAYLLCGWLAGLRLSGAVELEWPENDRPPWVNLERNRIVLPAEFCKAVEDQWVPLDPDLRRALLELPRQGRKVFQFRNRKGEVLGADAVCQRVEALAKKAGVKLTMKSLRKGFGCRYAGKVPAQVLQKLMRHANIRTTMDYYANVDDAVEEAVLGPQRNTSRNNSPTPASAATSESDANPSTPTTNSPSRS